MELPCNLLEHIAYNNRSRIEEHMLIFMDESTHEEHLQQPIQTNNKQFKNNILNQCIISYYYLIIIR